MSHEIQELCVKFDIVFLQETWLLEFELTFVSPISKEFYNKGVSAVNDKNGLIKGRWHGGVAILRRKALNHCKILDFSDERILLFELICGDKKLLFANIYIYIYAILL